MNNIAVFLKRYFNLILFFILQILCIVLLVKNSETYEVAYAGVANEVTGRVNVQFNKVENFFHLRESNRLLLEENTRLKNLLKVDFEIADTAKNIVIDSLERDTLGRQRKFVWLPAKVLNNTVSQQFNYLTLHRGAMQNVKKDMAVIGQQGIVGTVVDVSDNFCRVMSLLHRNSKVSAMLKKQSIRGTVEWDGQDPRYVTLRNIPKSIKVAKGDTIVTSNYSANFPPALIIGTIEQVEKDPGSNYFIIKLKTATNFYTLEYVNLVENVQWSEQKRLEATPIKNQ